MILSEVYEEIVEARIPTRCNICDGKACDFIDFNSSNPMEWESRTHELKLARNKITGRKAIICQKKPVLVPHSACHA